MVSIGQAAHIIAAASDGPRPKTSEYSQDFIISEANGLWLCASCHSLVDRDPSYFSAERLNAWKILAEKEVDYDAPSIAVSLPGHIVRSSTAFGLHMLVGPARGLKGVCHKMSLEVLSQAGLVELRAQRFYEDVHAGHPVVGADWHSFLLSEGQEANLYFGKRVQGWSDLIIKNSGVILLIRAKVYSRLGGEELDPFYSPWEIGIINSPVTVNEFSRVEYDEDGKYQYLLAWADVLQKLLKSETMLHRNFAKHVLDLQQFRQFERVVVQTIGNQYIAAPPTLFRASSDTTSHVLPELRQYGELIEGCWSDRSYFLKRSYSDRSGNTSPNKTDVMEFCVGCADDYAGSGFAWDARWLKGGAKTQRMIPDGQHKVPPGF